MEKERRLQLKCWKRRVEYSSKLGLPIKNTYKQCIELPRAIATIDALPVKGSKANATAVYEKSELIIWELISREVDFVRIDFVRIDLVGVDFVRIDLMRAPRYREATELVILTLLPHGWAPNTVECFL